MASICYEHSLLRPYNLKASLLSILHTSRLRTPLHQQTRHANFIHRPRRPYIFSQLVQLTDGSTYTIRTTTPNALYRPAKDTRNTLTWQPSEKSLHNLELDEAGKLAGFRQRYGRSFDIVLDKAKGEPRIQDTDDFSDLITKYASENVSASMKSPPKTKPAKKK